MLILKINLKKQKIIILKYFKKITAPIIPNTIYHSPFNICEFVFYIFNRLRHKKQYNLLNYLLLLMLHY
jgi:hypothetical protein